MKGDFFIPEVLAIELKVWRLNHQCYAFRLETRAKELIVMARLSQSRRSRRETEFSHLRKKSGEACESALSHGGKARIQSIYS